MKKKTKKLISALAGTVALGAAGIISSNSANATGNAPKPQLEQQNSEQQTITIRFKVKNRHDYLIPVKLDHPINLGNVQEIRDQLNNQYFKNDQGINFSQLKKDTGAGNYVISIFGQKSIDALDLFLTNGTLTETTRKVDFTINKCLNSNTIENSTTITLNVPIEIKTIGQLREYFNSEFFAKSLPNQPILSNFKFGKTANGENDLNHVEVKLIGQVAKKYNDILLMNRLINPTNTLTKEDVTSIMNLITTKPEPLAVGGFGTTYLVNYKGQKWIVKFPNGDNDQSIADAKRMAAEGYDVQAQSIPTAIKKSLMSSYDSYLLARFQGYEGITLVRGKAQGATNNYQDVKATIQPYFEGMTLHDAKGSSGIDDNNLLYNYIINGLSATPVITPTNLQIPPMIALQLAAQLMALHEAGFVHGDLKDKNVMINYQPKAGNIPATVDSTIIDLDTAVKAGSPRKTCSENAAPEIFEYSGDGFGLAAFSDDIYSFGTMLPAIFFGDIAGGDQHDENFLDFNDPEFDGDPHSVYCYTQKLVKENQDGNSQVNYDQVLNGLKSFLQEKFTIYNNMIKDKLEGEGRTEGTCYTTDQINGLADLTAQMLNPNAKSRPTIQKVFKALLDLIPKAVPNK